MLINRQRGEINFKIVYYGVAEGGKTTNLEYIHNHINPDQRTKLISIKTEGDRTLYFDFLHIELSAINGFKPKFNFYTVPGQTVYSASRKLVLRGADGVVFVADSQEQRLADNHKSLAELRVYLNGNGNGRSFAEFPLSCNATSKTCRRRFPRKSYVRSWGCVPSPILARLPPQVTWSLIR